MAGRMKAPPAIFSQFWRSVLLLLFLFSSLFNAGNVFGQLVVNVKNNGGETLVEQISANTSADTVTLELLASDGSYVTQFIDYKSEINIFRVHVLGEEELGRTEPQILCFVSRFMRTDFISSDAMSKLRQKNPTAIRTPEEERGLLTLSLDLSINPSKAYVISPHIFNVCNEARDGIFGQESDLRTISKSLAKDYHTLMSSTSPLQPNKYSRCRDMTQIHLPCVCRLHLCLGWYPCGLKYCHGTDATGRVVSYRCGIKTCKRCMAFNYPVKYKYKCLWDFD